MAGSHDKEHRVRVRAYHLWETEGRPDGREAEFWHRAAELDHLESTAGQDAPPLPQPTAEPAAAAAVKKPRAKAQPASKAKPSATEAAPAKATPPKRAGAPAPQGEPKPGSARPRAKARIAEHP
jgi:hypothetical protein